MFLAVGKGVTQKMMIGRTEGQESSYISQAVRGRALAERRIEQAALKDDAFGAPYRVELSDRLKNIATYQNGSLVEIGQRDSHGRLLSREEELAVLHDKVAVYQEMNETYRRTGSPVDSEALNRKLQEEMLDRVEKMATGGRQEVQSVSGDSGLPGIEQDFSQIRKTPTGFEDKPVPKIEYTPVTEIRSRHYRWTEEDGIEETLTQEAEWAQSRAYLRERIEHAATDAIKDILEPCETYEEAMKKLYTGGGQAPIQSYDRENMTYTITLRPVDGAYAVLGTVLNNFQEEFGSEDSFYDTLLTALNDLDPQGDNELVKQIRRMVKTVQGGQQIDVDSDEFKKDIEDAVARTYGIAVGAKKEEKPQNVNTKQQETTGRSYLDMQLQRAKEESRLLDELLGTADKETEHDEKKIESAGDILKHRQPEGKDAGFIDKLRRVDERKEPAKPYVFSTGEQKAGTPIAQEQREAQQAAYDKWLAIGERLTEVFAADRSTYYEKAFLSAVTNNVDISG